jgi:hypothetical protein
MENWGLITGRTSAFLLDLQRADVSSRKRVATVQSHEVAHMWWVSIFHDVKDRIHWCGKVRQHYNDGVVELSVLERRSVPASSTIL